jgi:hypothetical protein
MNEFLKHGLFQQTQLLGLISLVTGVNYPPLVQQFEGNDGSYRNANTAMVGVSKVAHEVKTQDQNSVGIKERGCQVRENY